MAIPIQISERWLVSKRSQLGMTRKTDGDGEPNPAHAKLAAEIADAEAELTRWTAFADWVATAKGMRLNSYPLRTGGATYKPGEVFLRKDKETGVVSFTTRQNAWEEYEARAKVQQ